MAEVIPLTPIERFLNRAMGWALRLGIAPRDAYLLEVRGRKSGKLYTTPVNLLVRDGRQYLIASRGETQWARNARAAAARSGQGAELVLRKGARQFIFRAVELPDAAKPDLLKAFLDRFALQVQRFHSVSAGSPASAHAADAARHPVFELIAVDPRRE